MELARNLNSALFEHTVPKVSQRADVETAAMQYLVCGFVEELRGELQDDHFPPLCPAPGVWPPGRVQVSVHCNETSSSAGAKMHAYFRLVVGVLGEDARLRAAM